MSRPLRILFVVQRGTLLRFALLIPALAERGHHVHIAFAAGRDWQKPKAATPAATPERAVTLADDLHARFPELTYGPAPQIDPTDSWRQVAWIVRGLADLAHNAHPRYTGAKALRRRTRDRVLKRLRQDDFEPLARRLALRIGRRLNSETDARRSRSMLRITARLEDAIPTNHQIDHYIEELAPDVVLTTGTFRHASGEVEFMKSARRLGIPSGIFVASWDNLTNKGSLKFTPERVFVWNDAQAEDAVELHRIPRERVVATGAHAFDQWFERRPSRSREQLLAGVGLDPAQPYLVYLCSSGNIVVDSEVDLVKRWVEALRSASDERLRRMNVIVRPHPNTDFTWQSVDFGSGVVVWPAKGAYPVAAEARADFFDTLYHSSAVVGMNTTAMIEAAVVGKSVLTVLVPEFRQETTLHFHYLLAENGGFLHVAASVDEHVKQLSGVLDEDAAGAELRRRFVESFVRPGGLDRPAAPIAASAIEELADLPVQARTRPGTRLLRLVLSVEAGLTTAYTSYRRLRGRKRRSNKLALEPHETPR